MINQIVNKWNRNQNEKWFINKSDYQNDIWPPFIPGPWLIPNKLIGDLYETAITKSLPALPFDDAFITMIVAGKLNVQLQELDVLIFEPKIDSIDYCSLNDVIIFWQGFTDKTLIFLWNNIIKTSNK